MKIKILHASGGPPLIPHLISDIKACLRVIFIWTPGQKKNTFAVSLTAIALGMMNCGSLLPAKPILVYLLFKWTYNFL